MVNKLRTSFAVRALNAEQGQDLSSNVLSNFLELGLAMFGGFFILLLVMVFDR
ncbi:MAG: hypothetical protein K1Y36_02355 [Blastocatellia bacterium]|nr:hypothetical protein [Blastocatellia bacterium]